MPDRPSAPRGPARRHDPPGPHRHTRRTAARPTLATTTSRATTRARRGSAERTGRGRPWAAAALPVTVWLLDEPGSSQGLRARVRAGLAATPVDRARTTHTPAAGRRPGGGVTPGAGGAPAPHDGRDGVEPARRGSGARAVCGEGTGSVRGARDGVTPPAHPEGDDDLATGAPTVAPAQTDSAAPSSPAPCIPAATHTCAPHASGSTSGSGLRAAASQPRCAFLDVGPGPIETYQLTAAAAQLSPGEVLAVFTLSHRDGRRLRDPRPELMVAAAAAGLEHLQHIVTITRAASTGTVTGAGWALGPDVSLFRRARPDPGPGSESGSTDSESDGGARREARA